MERGRMEEAHGLANLESATPYLLDNYFRFEQA